MSELGELNQREQEALFWLCAQLLHMDWPIRIENRERLTLLWLDWRDRWGESASKPPDTQIDRATAAMDSANHWETDHRTRQAINVLKSSGRGFAIIRFLLQVADENGVNEEEEVFLQDLRGHLERFGFSQGVYR